MVSVIANLRESTELSEFRRILTQCKIVILVSLMYSNIEMYYRTVSQLYLADEQHRTLTEIHWNVTEIAELVMIVTPKFTTFLW